MKAIKFLRMGIILVGILLSACAAVPASTSASADSAGDQTLSSKVVFTGAIDSINGDQWVINGQTIKVDQSVVRDGSFLVGDTAKVEAVVAADGSITAQRVESPSVADLVEMTASTPEASSISMSGSSTPQPLIFNDSGTEALGIVESITATSITIGGQTFTFGPGVEIKGVIVPGAQIKLHFTTNANGTLSVTQIEFADPSQIGNDNSNDDNSNNSLSNDDNSNNGNDNNSNDDNGNDDDSNDDNGGNSNDDKDGDDNSNDNNNNG
ncbi:MAG: DUF5666 domain-containing protein [Chloroflexota bacterium]